MELKEKMMHTNSLIAYDELIPTLSAREGFILDIIVKAKKPMSDWDILQVFKKGSDNLNLIRPRVSDLHDKKVLIEGAPARSHTKNMPVRTSVLNFEVKPQQEMF